MLSGRDAVEYARRFSAARLLASVDNQRMFRGAIAEFGECARCVSTEFKDTHSNIPWRQANDLRNVVIHQYDGVDYAKLHQIVSEEFSGVCDDLEQILNTEDPIDDTEESE